MENSPAVRRSRASGELCIVLSAVCFSFGGILIKAISWHPMAIAGARSLLAIPVLLLFNKKISLKLNKISLAATLCTALTMFSYIFATKLTTAANAIVLQYVAPVFVILYAFLLLKKIPSRLDICALAVCLGGIMLFFLDELSSGGMAGNLLALFSGVTYAGMYFLNSLPGANPVASTIYGHLCVVVFGLPFLLVPGNDFAPSSLLAMLALGIFQLGFGYLFFTKGIVRTDATSAILISMIEPIINPLLVFVFLRELPGAFALTGGAIVIAAITIWNIIKAARSKKLEKEDLIP